MTVERSARPDCIASPLLETWHRIGVPVRNWGSPVIPDVTGYHPPPPDDKGRVPYLVIRIKAGAQPITWNEGAVLSYHDDDGRYILTYRLTFVFCVRGEVTPKGIRPVQDSRLAHTSPEDGTLDGLHTLTRNGRGSGRRAWEVHLDP